MGIYNKLAKIQAELIAPKGQYNSFGKYSYRSCEDILKALKPLCDANACTCFITNDLLNIGNFNYVMATVTLIDLETGEKVVSTAHAREEAEKKGMDGSQITGASSSYARKYALAGLFCIDNEKDSDATNNGTSAKNEAVNTAELRAKVMGYVNRHNMDKTSINKICSHYKVKSLVDLTAAQCTDYIEALKKNGGSIDE